MKGLGAFCLLCVVTVGAQAARAQSPADIRAGYAQVISDLNHHWWNSAASPPHIRPTRGGNSPGALDVGLIDNRAPRPSFWQMCQDANVLFWDWKITHSDAARFKLLSQWNYISRCYPDQAIISAARSDGIVNVADDGAWAVNYLVQVHEVSGDRRALAGAMKLLGNILDRFADPNQPRVNYGSLRGSPYGILYATPTDDPDHQARSSLFDIMLADAALYIYQQNHDADYLKFAVGTYNCTRKYLKQPNRGYYYCELDIRPTVNGASNDHFLKPIGDYYGPPVRGLSSSYSGGTMAMAVAAARLFRITSDPQYLAEAQKITADYTRRDAFFRPGNLFVNERDAWTDGYWAPWFAAEVLPLPNVDASGRWKNTLRNTALSIIFQRTRDGFYTADWSGPELNTNDKSMTWAQQARAGNGSGAGMALPEQIMTSSTSAAMVSAAMLIETSAKP